MDRHRVVIVGGGFAGLFAAKELGDSGFDVTLLDRRNFHLFQPLLYQVATGSLAVDDIATPQRVVLRRYANVCTLLGTAFDLDPHNRRVHHEHGELSYDTLLVATGVKHHYFGQEHWRAHAPGLKTIEHALEMRYRVFRAFEQAEAEPDPVKRAACMTFVIVGGGPTGVELAGALGELAHHTMRNDFRRIDPSKCRLLLLQGPARVLPDYSEKLSARAQRDLEALGVTVLTGSRVVDVQEGRVTYRSAGTLHEVAADTVLWAAGVIATGFGQVLRRRTGVGTASDGKVIVQPDLSVPGYPEIFVAGDLACCTDTTGHEVPGLAPAAIQQGDYVARLLKARVAGKTLKPFVYIDKGSMAVIGSNRAVGDLGRLKVTGFTAWLLWVAVHVWSLVGFEQRLRVMLRWTWKYATRKTGSRLITGGPANTSLLEREQSIRYGSAVNTTEPAEEPSN
ncbi:MAG: NAD(P)/FAD-dependent oxidoreductase [Panacagrimonas sp.]